MRAEKPIWVSHEGTQIFSIDIQPGGPRFATGGGDHKVRIWNMESVDRNQKDEEPTQTLLATLRDHFGSVNCVRWAKDGRYVASGSDDQVILVHEKNPGSGTTEFGSGVPPDVESWKVAMTLKGHTADVVDLNWSPDDSILASGSLDNTIRIWNMRNGICTAVLKGHFSLVKGVTWDPIGSFLASQSDDKTVIIWRTSDWSLVHRTDGHWTKSLGSTFFRRLGWSPCGHFITTTHGFQKPRYSAPVLERGEWSATFDFLGHNAPVIVVKFNHSMFRRNVINTKEVKAAPIGWTSGASKNGGKELEPYNVIAIGSQDCTITVWTTGSSRPLFVAKHFFSQSVVDLSWSPDGYSLFACSLDGTVAIFHFEGKELGYKLSDVELDELKKSRYGDVRDKQENLIESPAQLLLKATSAKQTPSKTMVSDARQNQATIRPSIVLAIPAMTLPQRVDESRKKSGVLAGGDLGKFATPIPVKQREYRCPDGRKRIIPEAVGVPAHAENIPGNVQTQSHDFPLMSSEHGNDNNGLLLPVDRGIKEASVRGKIGRSSDRKEQFGVTARAIVTESLVIKKVKVSANRDGSNNVLQSGTVKASNSLTACGNSLSIKIFDTKGEDSLPIRLEARSRECAVNDIVGMGNMLLMKETEVSCARGDTELWSDRISGKVTVLAGNANFWAAGCEDGCLQVYTKCGRRAMPTVMMGSAASFIDCDESWKLLVVTRSGSFYVWDLFSRVCVLNDSLASLMTSDFKSLTKDAGTMQVISVKLSKCGYPLVVLATRHAFLFDMSLMCWLRVADDCFPASNFASSWNLGSFQTGELAALQVDVRKFLARKPGWTRVTDDGVQTRAHLEAQLASSLALKSPWEYRQCLLSYVRYLTREADESRLLEVCESFLGPPTRMGNSNITSPDSKNLAWNPYILGWSKQRLLREDILPAMASNRKVQRLLNEFMNRLSEYERRDINVEQEGLKLKVPATDQMGVELLATTGLIDADPPVLDKDEAELGESSVTDQESADQMVTDKNEQ